MGIVVNNEKRVVDHDGMLGANVSVPKVLIARQYKRMTEVAIVEFGLFDCEFISVFRRPHSEKLAIWWKVRYSRQKFERGHAPV